MFSSDDLPASSAENYAQPRRKRQHRRTWYEDEVNTAKRTRSLRNGKSTRGKFSRNFDSGVWMGSDDSVESGINIKEDTEPVERVRIVPEDPLDFTEHDESKVVVISVKKGPEWERHLRAKAFRTIDDPEDFNGPIWPYWQKQPTDLKNANRVQHDVAQDVGNIVSLGRDTIDLSGRHLTELRSATLRPLHSITNTHNLQPNSFVTFAPRLKLYLSSNNFTSVPNEIYQLKFLHVLSLRSNSISEILPAISALTNLEELNVGCNKLRYLPFELLALMKSARDQTRFNLFPNPFMRPFPSVRKKFCRAASPLLRGDGRRDSLAAIRPPCTTCDFKPYQVATTPIAFLDVSGASLPQHPPAPSECDSYILSPSRTSMLDPSPDLRTHAPSLLELSLQAAIRSPNLAQAPFLLSQGPNSHLGRLLQRAWHLKQAGAWAPSDGEPTTAHSRRKRSKPNGDGDGGQKCAICGKAFVVPRTEWLEWWRISAPVQKLREHIGSSFGQTGHRATIYALREDGESRDEGVHTPDDVEVVPFIRKGCSWACCPKLQGKVVRGWVSGAAEAT